MMSKENLTAAERRTLLSLARAAIRDRLMEDGSLDTELSCMERTPRLDEHRATFVTLKKRTGSGKTLRGCIGNMTPTEPLFRNVVENARRSAFRDPRFSPVTRDELPNLHLEISVLSAMKSVDGPAAIIPGRDGVELRKGAHSAVFLPQVATEQGWSVETLLENLAAKALLPTGAWQESDLFTFQAEVFGEE